MFAYTGLKPEQMETLAKEVRLLEANTEVVVGCVN